MTYDKPLSSAYTGDSELYDTCVWLGCDAAKGKSTEISVFNAIWDKFQTMSVRTKDGRLLSYWGAGANTREFYTIDDLLAHGDGRCGAWADFTNYVYNSQGIQCKTISCFHSADVVNNNNNNNQDIGVFYRNGKKYFLIRIVQNSTDFQNNSNLDEVYFSDHSFNKVTINNIDYYVDTTCKNPNIYVSAQELIENTIYLEVYSFQDDIVTTLPAIYSEFYSIEISDL